MKYEIKHQQISGGETCAQGKVQNSFVKFVFETKQKWLLENGSQVLWVWMQIGLIFLVLCWTEKNVKLNIYPF